MIRGVVFRSKVDYALFVPLLVLGLYLIYKATEFGANYGIFILLIPIFLIVWMMFDTWYEVSENSKLVIRFTVYRKIISIRDIKSVSRSKDLKSSPALSIDRLRIEYGANSSVLISPRKKKEFVDELLKYNPSIDLKNFH